MAGTLDVESQTAKIEMSDNAMADGATARTAGGNIRYQAGGSVLLGGLNAGSGVVVIEALGSVTDNGETDKEIIASAARIIAGDAIGSMANELDTNVQLIAGQSGNGGIHLFNDGDLIVGVVPGALVQRVVNDGSILNHTDPVDDSLAGLVTGVTGRVNLTSDAGFLHTVDSGIITDVLNAAAPGTIVLDTTVNEIVAATTANNSITIHELNDLTAVDINAGTNDVILTAGGNVTDGDAALDVQAGTFTATINGVLGGGALADDAIDTAVANLNVDTSAANGSQWIDELNALTTLNLNAGAGDVTLTTGGTVLDGDASRDIKATTFTGVINGAFGSGTDAADAIDTDVVHLNVNTSMANGSQWIDERNGLTTLNLNAGGGNVTLTAGAAVQDGDADADIQAATFTGVINGAFGAGATANDSIDTSVANLNVDTSNADSGQWIDEADALATLNLNAGVGNITLNAGGTVTDGDSDADVRASTFTATIEGAFGASGGGDNSIDTTVTNLNVDTTSNAADGNQWIDEADGLATLNLNAGVGNITLNSGGTVVDGDADADVRATTFTATIAGGLGAAGGGDNSVDTTVTNLNVDTTSTGANGSQWIDEKDGVDSLNLDAGAGDITLTSGGAILDGDMALDIQSTTFTGVIKGDFGSAASADDAIDTSVDHLNVDTAAADGSQWIDEMDALSSLNLTAGAGSVTLATGDAVQDADAATDIQAVTFTGVIGGAFGDSAAGAAIDTAVSNLNVSTMAVDASQWINESDSLAMLNLDAGMGNIDLTTGGSIMDGDGALDIQATTFTGVVNGNFGAATSAVDAVDTSVANLNVDTAAANGSQWIDEADGLATLNLSAGAGDVTLTTGGEVLDDDANADIQATTFTGMIAGAFGAMGGGDNSIDTVVTNLNVDTTASGSNGGQWIDEADGLATLNLNAGSGTITLNSGGTVTDLDADADVRATTFTATIEGDFGAVGGGDKSIDTRVTNLNVDTTSNGANGNQWIDEADGLATLNLNAGAGNITLNSGGTVTDVDGVADVRATTFTATIAGDFGAMGGGDSSIDTTVANLNVDTTASGSNGNQWIDEADGLATLNLNAGSGNITLNSGGRVVDGDADADVRATTFTATIEGDFGAVGGGDNSIDTTVTNLNVDTTSNGADGSQWIDEADGLATLNLDAGIGSVHVNAGAAIEDSDVNEDITAAAIDLVAGSGIGALKAVQISETTLNARSDAGDIQLTGSGAMTAELVDASGAGAQVVLVTLAGDVLVDDVRSNASIQIDSAAAINELGDDMAADLTSGSLTLTAESGVGNAGTIESAVDSMIVQTNTGGIDLLNLGGLIVNGATVAVSGGISIVTTSPMIIAGDVRAPGDVLLDAREISDAPVWGDDLVVKAGVTVESIDAGVTLRAGDDLILEVGSTIRATALMRIVGGHEDVDGGASASLLGTIFANGGLSVFTLGDLTVGEIISTGQTVELISQNGSILDGNGGGVLNVTAATLTAGAAMGVALDTAASDLDLSTDAGNIDVVNTLSTPVTAKLSVEGMGVVDLRQSGGGSLTVTEARTGDGDIMLQVVGANLEAQVVEAGGQGNVFLETTMSGDVLLGSVTAADDTLNIDSIGAVLDALVGEAANLVGATALITAVNGVGTSAEDVDTELVSLDARNSGVAGGIFVTELASGGDLDLAARLTNAAGAGHVVVVVEGGGLTIPASGGGVDVAGSGNVLIEAQGAQSDLTLLANVSATGGSISLLSAGGVVQGEGVEVASGGGTIDVEATGGSVAMAAAARLASDGGASRIAAATDVMLGVVDAGDGGPQSGWGSVSVIATNGSILETTDASATTTHILASAVRLDAGNAVGGFDVREYRFEFSSDGINWTPLGFGCERGRHGSVHDA